MNEGHGPLLVLPTACRDAARSQITLSRLVNIIQVIILLTCHSQQFYYLPTSIDLITLTTVAVKSVEPVTRDFCVFSDVF